ncbi:MAG: SH3 domain-containing protein, partial [Rickettsiales bacterium]|nr:SH3 domain-containing protein [Rickettsiales bacterium]
MEKAKIWCSLGLIFISLCTVIFLIFLYKKYSDYRHRDLYSYVDANPLDYWKNERSYSAAIMLDKGDIDEINARINSKMIKINEDKGVPGELATYNLLDYRTRLSRETIVDMIKITADKFFENIPDDSYYNFNSLLEENEISYAIAVEKSDIRTIPTDIHTFCSKDVDLTQGTSIRFGEPLIVIHKTADNLWSFVRTYNVMGWIRTKNIAAVSRDEFANYINMAKFLVVISKNELISGKYLDMGAKLELDGESEKFYSVKFPVRDKNGFIYYQKLELEKKPGLHRGYLDYSEKNIVEQAMKYYETPYVWGSADNGVDCSGL